MPLPGLCPTTFQGQCLMEEWLITLGLGSLGTASCSSWSSSGTWVAPEHPRSHKALPWGARLFWSLLRCDCALFLHFLLCRNALSVGNHKEEKCKEWASSTTHPIDRCFRAFLCRQFSKRISCVGKASQGLWCCWLRLTNFGTQILATLLASVATDSLLHPLRGGTAGVFVIQWFRPFTFTLQFCFPLFPQKHSLYYRYPNSAFPMNMYLVFTKQRKILQGWVLG